MLKRYFLRGISEETQQVQQGGTIKDRIGGPKRETPGLWQGAPQEGSKIKPQPKNYASTHPICYLH